MAEDNSLSPRDELFMRMMQSKNDVNQRSDIDVESDVEDIESDVTSIKQKFKRFEDYHAQNKKYVDTRLSKLENSVSSISISNKKSISELLNTIKNLSSDINKKVDDVFFPIRKRLSTLYDEVLERIKKSKVLDSTISKVKESQNKMFKTVESSLSSVYTKLNSVHEIIDKLHTSTEDAVIGTLKNIKNVITYPFSLVSQTWNFLKSTYNKNKVGKVLRHEPNTISSNIKRFFSFALKPIKWILRVGTEAFKFIWKGLRTILLDVPYAVIKKAVNIAGKGIEKFMSWVGDLFLNIFRFPWILFIGIPFLMFVVPKIINIVWDFLKKNLKLLWNIVDKHLNISEIWNSFIWPTVNNFWKWLTGNRINKWWSQAVPKIKDWVYQFFSWMFGEDTIRKFISGSRKIWNWAKSKWDDIVYSYNFLKEVFSFLGSRWLVHAATKLVSIGLKFIQFTYKIASFIVGIAIKAAKMIAKVAWAGLKLLGRGLARLLPRLAGSLKRFIGPIASAVGRTLKIIGTKILSKIGINIGIKVGLRTALKFIPVIGWGIGLILDTWEIGKAVFHGFKALSARASARETASEWAGQNVESFSGAIRTYKAIQSGDYHAANFRYRRTAKKLETFGLSQTQIQQTLGADAAYNSMKVASVYYEGLWRSLSANAEQDSAAESYEVQAAKKVANRFDGVFKFIQNYKVEDYESISTTDLKKMLSKTKSALKGTWNIWNNMKTSARKGVNSSWISDPAFTQGIPDAMNKYDDIIKMTEQYIAQREKREQAFAGLNSQAIQEGRVADMKDMFVSPNTIQVFHDITDNKNPLKNLSEDEHYFANEKLLKAIQFGYQNGLSAKSYVMAGLQYNYSDPEFLRWGEKLFMAGVQERRQKPAGNKPLPIFIPENFSKSDVEKFEAGGVIVPYETENVVLPLNDEGKKHIQSQLENISIPEIKKIKKENSNITIIEQHISNEESYEIYAMGQISRGILGVGK